MDTDTWFTFFALLTVGANVATLALWGVVVAGLVSPGARDLAERVRVSLGESGLAVAAVVAAVAMGGSLYLSEGADLVPCLLCWYQRCAMYPLAVILVVAAVRRDWAVRPYAIVLSAIGPLISIYHYTEQRFPDLDSGSCDPLNPCNLTLIWKFHYVSIPFMALSAFVLVLSVMVLARVPDPGGPTDAWEHAPEHEQTR